MGLAWGDGTLTRDTRRYRGGPFFQTSVDTPTAAQTALASSRPQIQMTRNSFCLSGTCATYCACWLFTMCPSLSEVTRGLTAHEHDMHTHAPQRD